MVNNFFNQVKNQIMKKAFLLFALILIVLGSEAQDKEASVEKSTWGIQLGVPPLAVYNESRLADKFSLRSELNLGFGWQSSYNGTLWTMPLYVQVEPRYYYNIKRRAAKKKRIDGNSGNFLSLVIGGEPGIGITSKDVQLYTGVYLIPFYGMRRNIGMHFNYELALGVGYNWSFHSFTNIITRETYYETEHGVALGLRIAIGYRF